MTRRSPILFGVIVVLLVVGLGGILLSQWKTTLQLEGQLEAARLAREDLARLRVEGERLQARQVSREQLETLRADHAAVARLRAELQALQPR
jgi:hypothetical protein